MAKKTSIRSVFLAAIPFFALLGIYAFKTNYFGHLPSPVLPILGKVILVLIFLSGAAFVNRLVKFFVWDRFAKRPGHGEVPQLLKDLAGGLIYILAITFIIAYVFKQNLVGFWATSSVLALVVGFALRNMILDLFTGLAVNIERPYKVGDWIEVHSRLDAGQIVGHVQEINWRATRLTTEENKSVIIPNSLMTTFIVTNYWSGNNHVRFEAIVPLEYSLDVERAKRILLAAAKSLVNKHGFLNREPSILIHDITDRGIEFQVRYWIRSWDGVTPSLAKDLIYSRIVDHLKKAGLSISYSKEDVFHAPLPKRNLSNDSLEDRIEILKRVDLFQALTSKEQALLAQNIDYRIFNQEQEIIRQGENEHSMFVLVEGLLEVWVRQDNQDLKVAEIGPGQHFGEMSMLTGEERSATVKSITPATVYEIKKSSFKELIDDRPEIIERISTIITERKSSNQKLLEETELSAKEDVPHLSQSILQKIKNFFK